MDSAASTRSKLPRVSLPRSRSRSTRTDPKVSYRPGRRSGAFGVGEHQVDLAEHVAAVRERQHLQLAGRDLFADLLATVARKRPDSRSAHASRRSAMARSAPSDITRAIRRSRSHLLGADAVSQPLTHGRRPVAP